MYVCRLLHVSALTNQQPINGAEQARCGAHAAPTAECSWLGSAAQHCRPKLSCCAGAGFFWAWRFQQFSRGPKRALYGWPLPIAKACGNAMKIAVWPVLILPLSYVFTTPLRCSLGRHSVLVVVMSHVSQAAQVDTHTCLWSAACTQHRDCPAIRLQSGRVAE